ncbi:unnamed protein product [Lactuca virosa]|uniref:Uncharacterized protein n=1 Tax=Lactuca virosa TaxID=75947 RepID=A0AAU9LPF5_9ASTR|nr:unnamed protein product [Lactuca virosa]
MISTSISSLIGSDIYFTTFPTIDGYLNITLIWYRCLSIDVGLWIWLIELYSTLNLDCFIRRFVSLLPFPPPSPSSAAFVLLAAFATSYLQRKNERGNRAACGKVRPPTLPSPTYRRRLLLPHILRNM